MSIKSTELYKLAKNAVEKIFSGAKKILFLALTAAILATAPIALTSCENGTAICEDLPEVSKEEMNEFVEHYLKYSAPVGGLSNYISLAYSLNTQDGILSGIKVVMVMEYGDERHVRYHEASFTPGLSQRDIRNKQITGQIGFTDTTLKTLNAGEAIDLAPYYAEYLGSEDEYYILAEYPAESEGEKE